MTDQQNQNGEAHEVEGERGLPPVNPKKTGSGISSKVGMVVIGTVALLAILAVNGVFSKKEVKAGAGVVVEEEKQKKVVRSTLPELPAAEPKKPVEPVVVEKPKPIVPKVIRTNDIPPARPQFRVVEDRKKTITPDQRKRQSGLFVDLDDNRRAEDLPAPAVPQGQTASFFGGEAEEKTAESTLASKLTPTVMEGVSASMLPDRNLLVTQGHFIDCALETAISSDLPGMLSCRVTRDVYSTNGNVLLIERGSRAVGQYQGGLQRGKARIFAVWNRIETPSGVIISLNSPGTDALGRSGHSGYIDKHFWERFGGAILLSVIDDLGNYLVAKASENDGVQIGSTAGTAQEAGSIALENSINIPPTLYKNQGEHINIFVARDLDFRGVYRLAAEGY